jgi:hypothetical protein
VPSWEIAVTDLLDTIHSTLSPPLAQAVSDMTVLAGAHPIMTFMTFALASIFVLNRSGSAH